MECNPESRHAVSLNFIKANFAGMFIHRSVAWVKIHWPLPHLGCAQLFRTGGGVGDREQGAFSSLTHPCKECRLARGGAASQPQITQNCLPFLASKTHLIFKVWARAILGRGQILKLFLELDISSTLVKIPNFCFCFFNCFMCP